MVLSIIVEELFLPVFCPKADRSFSVGKSFITVKSVMPQNCMLRLRKLGSPFNGAIVVNPESLSIRSLSKLVILAILDKTVLSTLDSLISNNISPLFAVRSGKLSLVKVGDPKSTYVNVVSCSKGLKSVMLVVPFL